MLTSCLVAVSLLVVEVAVPPLQQRATAASPDALKGATTVFVDAGADMPLRAAIVEQLAKELPGLAVVDRPEAAAMILRYSTSVGERPAPRVFKRTQSVMSERTDVDNEQGHHGSHPGARSQRRQAPPVIKPPAHLRNLENIAPEPPAPGHTRYGHGIVLKQTGADQYVEAVVDTRRIGRSAKGAAGDFVKRFAKEYRKANNL